MWPFKNNVPKVDTTHAGSPSVFDPMPTRVCAKCGHLVAANRIVTVMHKHSYNNTVKEYFCEEHAPPYHEVTYSAFGSHVAYTRDRVERTHYCIDGVPFRTEYLS